MTPPGGIYTFYPKLDYTEPSFRNLTRLIEPTQYKKDAYVTQKKLINDCFTRKYQPPATLPDLEAIASKLKDKRAFADFDQELAKKASQGRFFLFRDVYATFYDSVKYKEIYDKFRALERDGSEDVDKLLRVLRDKTAPAEWKASLLTNDLVKYPASLRQLDDVLDTIKAGESSFLVPIYNEALRKIENSDKVGANIAKKFIKTDNMREALAKAAIDKEGYEKATKVLAYLADDGGYKDIRAFIRRGEQLSNRVTNPFKMSLLAGRGLKRWFLDGFYLGDPIKSLAKFFVE